MPNKNALIPSVAMVGPFPLSMGGFLLDLDSDLDIAVSAFLNVADSVRKAVSNKTLRCFSQSKGLGALSWGFLILWLDEGERVTVGGAGGGSGKAVLLVASQPLV